MNRADPISTQLRAAFRPLDEPGVCIIVINPNLQVIWANAHAMKLFSADEDEILGSNACQVFDIHLTPFLDEKGDVQKLLTAMRDGDEVSGLELSVQNPDEGERRFVYSSRRLEQDPFAGIWVLRMRDVTGRKADERLLSLNRQLLILNQIMEVSASSLSLDELLDASLSRTLDLLNFNVGLIYLLNPERTLALTRYHHAVPKDYFSRYGTITVHHWPWNLVFVAGQPCYVEQHNESGTVAEEVLSSLGVSALACIPILAESIVVGALFLGSRDKQRFEDEERRLLEAVAREIGSGVLRSMLHKRLEAAHRETNLYLDIMTHDLKNAENVANLYCDLLLDMLEDDAALYARKLKGSVRKSTRILQNVSTIRRIHQEPPDLKPIRLSSVIRAGIDRIPEAKVALFVDTSVEVLADDLLPEIFSNLVGNAVKFGGPDAGIAIRVENDPGEDRTVVVTVEDTGPGIPDGMKEAIFHRFREGKSQGHGDGLGLYIVGMLIERYGGRIWAEDRVCGRPDLGASFRFTLREAVHGETGGHKE